MNSFKKRKALEQAKKRQERTLKAIALLEKKLPAIKHVSRSPKYGKWMPTIVAVFEVGLPLLLIIIIPPLLALIPWPHIDIPFPHINLPNINFPNIHIPFPNINLPKPPEWLADILYWLKKTLPIWIAVGFVYYEIRKNKHKDKKN